LITTNIFQRTFHIRHNGCTGTCFTIDVEDKRYLITARHVVETIRNNATVEISHEKGWLPIRVRLVGHGEGKIDVTALAPQTLFGPRHPLTLTCGGVTLAEDLYFLGFPYGLEMTASGKFNVGFPLPLVKKAILSLLRADGLMLLDGHNNFGFSGGPVARRGTAEEQTVIGVVSGYRYDRRKVLNEKGEETSFTYDTNTGIIIAHDIEHAVKMVMKNPIGIAVDCPA